jgi:type I restriction enzyme R subunit
MPTDTSEKGLETLIMHHMTGVDGLAFAGDGAFSETPDAIAAQKVAGSGWLAGNPKDFDRAYALDVPQLFQFLQATQPEAFKKIGMVDYKDAKVITRLKFLSRLSNEIGKRGVIDVLRKGIEDGPLHFDLFTACRILSIPFDKTQTTGILCLRQSSRASRNETFGWVCR